MNFHAKFQVSNLKNRWVIAVGTKHYHRPVVFQQILQTNSAELSGVGQHW